MVASLKWLWATEGISLMCHGQRSVRLSALQGMSTYGTDALCLCASLNQQYFPGATLCMGIACTSSSSLSKH